MNIIRTTAVELSTIPAIAYKQKLATGGAGVKLLRLDTEASAVFTIDRRSGEATPYGTYDTALFPDEAVDEARELTSGLPYSARGKIKVSVTEPTDAGEDAVLDNDADQIDMVDSPEYAAIIARYAGEDGKLNYALMNKDLIQFASKSTMVGQMIAQRDNADDIVAYVVANRAIQLTRRKDNLSPQEVTGLIETLDEINPRSAFKELALHIRRLLARSK